MRYVQRDKAGNIIGHYAQPQLGTSRNRETGEVIEAYAVEALPDDHPDITGFHARIREAGERAKAAAGPPVQERLAALERELAELKAKVR